MRCGAIVPLSKQLGFNMRATPRLKLLDSQRGSVADSGPALLSQRGRESHSAAPAPWLPCLECMLQSKGTAQYWFDRMSPFFWGGFALRKIIQKVTRRRVTIM